MQNANVSDAITQKVWQIVNALPQRGAIVEADARFWVEEVVGTYGELAIWHATRAGGFGGSQIGALVRNHMNQRADHEQSAHDIVAGALLRKVPDEPNGHMRRGIAMETMHRRWFYEKHLAKRDEAGFKTLSESTGARPWMRYSPDDLVLVPRLSAEGSVLGKPVRKLIDFKAPSKVEQAEKVAFQYVCQLHMGRLVCEQNGVSIDDMLLSQFDWANWELKDDEISHIPQLDELILISGDFYWDYVLRGELPPYVRKPRLDAEAIGPDVRESAGRLARLKAIVSVLGKRVETLEEEVKPALEKARFGTSRLQLDGISFTAVPKFDEEMLKTVPEELLRSVPLKANASKRYDEDKMLARLRALGEQTSQFLRPAGLDGEALYAALCDAGYDAESFIGEQLRGAVDKKLAEEAAAIVDREYQDLLRPQVRIEPESEESNRVGQQAQRSVPRSLTV
jgi:hypothetical protein